MENQPPRFIKRLLAFYCNPERFEEIEGDLEELFQEQVQTQGLPKAKWRYLWDVVRCLKPYALKRKINAASTLLPMDMLLNYWTVAWRNLLRHKTYSAINILGLSLGMASVVLISLYVKDELSYDRYHRYARDVYRVVQQQHFANSQQQLASTSGLLAAALRNEYPEVEQSTRVHVRSNLLLSTQKKTIPDETVAFADDNVFKLFSFSFLQGSPATALQHPHSLVLTQKTAHLFFADENPLGKTIRFNTGESYLITGIIVDPPSQSHFHFDALASLSTLEHPREWLNSKYLNSVYTYLLLGSHTQAKSFDRKLLSFVGKFRGDQVATYRLQPLTDIHLHSDLAEEIEPNGNATIVYTFMGVAVVILLLACLNYIILATAHYTKRLKEVGLRKTLGAGRFQLAVQFWMESAGLTLLGFTLALLWIALSLSFFNELTRKQFTFGSLIGWREMGSVGLLLVLVSTLSSVYPAWHVSRLGVVATLKGNRVVSKGGWGFRNGLVTLQFTISIVLMVVTLVVYQQLDYIASKPLGFHQAQVINLKVRYQPNRASKIALFKQEISQLPGIIRSATSSSTMGEELFASEVRLGEGSQKVSYVLRVMVVDADYFQTLGLEMACGRAFSPHLASDTSRAFIINQAAVRQLGYPSAREVIGKELEYWGGGRFKEPIIGVVKDFHYASLHQEIQPLLMMCWPSKATRVSVQIQSGETSQVLAGLENAWKRIFPDYPFEYRFANESLAQLYQTDQLTRRLLVIFSSLAILIACLGLFGLVTFSVLQRTKEIGIRKVLGASVNNLVALIATEFLRLVAIAFVVSVPIAWMLMNRWLQDFAYRIRIGWWVFALAGMAALLISLLTVSFQAIKAALVNPVKSLRTE